MKKLMIAAAIAMVAVASQAASFEWKADGANGKDWADAWIGETAQVNAFLYLGEVTFDGNLETREGVLNFGDATPLISGEQNSSNFMYGSNGKKISSDKLASDAAGQAYTIILAEVTTLGDYPMLGEGKHFAILAGTTDHFVNPMDESDTWAGMLATYKLTQNDWYTTPVPEPTSAMLLLLGVAGLALRRKAK